jgi:F-type H+-transporting ATPase subunit alpha
VQLLFLDRHLVGVRARQRHRRPLRLGLLSQRLDARLGRVERGARLVELLKQPQYAPSPVERQVVSVWAGTSGYLDDVPIEDIGRFEDEFLGTLGRKHPGIYESISATGELSEDTATALKDAIEDFRRGFEISGGGMLVSDEPAEPLDEAEVSRDAVSKRIPPRPKPSE